MQENHEEFEIFLQKMLNFMFNQELHFRKGEHQFIEEIPDLNLGRPFR